MLRPPITDSFKTTIKTSAAKNKSVTFSKRKVKVITSVGGVIGIAGRKIL